VHCFGKRLYRYDSQDIDKFLLAMDHFSELPETVPTSLNLVRGIGQTDSGFFLLGIFVELVQDFVRAICQTGSGFCQNLVRTFVELVWFVVLCPKLREACLGAKLFG